MALVYFNDEDNRGKKQYIGKAAMHRIVENKDQLIAKQKQRSEDHLALAERWGAKAAEFEKGKLEALAVNFKLKIALGVLGGYNILLTVLWCARNYS